MPSPNSGSTATMTRAEILSALQEMLREVLSLEGTEALGPEARLQEDLQIDSLATVDIIITVEEGFGIKLRSDLDFLSQVQTVGDVADLISTHLATSPTEAEKVS